LGDAPTPTDRGRVEALIDLATDWTRDGRRLIAGHGEAAETDAARTLRQRTTSEIAGLYVDGLVYGLGTGGWLATLADADSAAGYILPALLFAGTATAGIAIADVKADAFGYGVPRTISAGLRVGLMEGVAWTLWHEAAAADGDGWSRETVTTVIWLGPTVGGAIGAVVGHRFSPTPGAAAMVESGALWSALFAGMGVAALVADDDQADDAFMLAAALALNVGAAGGAVLAGVTEPSAARVRFLDLGALAGGLTFGGLYLSIADEDSDSQVGFGITALGIGTGLATAWLLTDGMARDPFLGPAPEAGATSHLMLLPVEGGGEVGLAGMF
ncbi:MAG: hypothetical protein KC620_21025, partial [Myxococcales bacterium]|nr:hypothetical protein [Myxococcales bacterium]